ncbi:hypothetical protein XaplCFBP3123_14190 [Xanthomonas arboricola pv. populi]|nr:hypothetical protein XaplCFBP3123_14190 [Xanthomonas arboricola pv. populi]
MTWAQIVRGGCAHRRVSNRPLVPRRRISSDDNSATLAQRSAPGACNRLDSWCAHARHQKSYWNRPVTASV